MQKEVLTQSKTAPSFASQNHFEILSDTVLPEAQVSECVLSAVPISVSAMTPMILRVQKPKWEKALPGKLTIATVEEVSTSLKCKVEIEMTNCKGTLLSTDLSNRISPPHDSRYILSM